MKEEGWADWYGKGGRRGEARRDGWRGWHDSARVEVVVVEVGLGRKGTAHIIGSFLGRGRFQ